MKEIRNPFGTWDDMSVPGTVAIQGQSSKPDYDYTNLGLLFPQNSATEIANFIIQFSHSKLLESAIYPHVHYIQDEATSPIFKIDYKWYNNGAAVPASWTTLSTADGAGAVFTYSSGSILQILPFPAITGLSGEGVSSNLEVKLYRDDNVVSGDVLMKYFDVHYLKDASGSKQAYTKWS